MGKRGRSAKNDNGGFTRRARDEDDTDDDGTRLTGLTAKIARQQKFLWEKMGGAEEEMHGEEEEENHCAVWSRSKSLYYGADEVMSSDEELLAEEEAEVIRLQREKAKSLSIEDFGLEEDIIKDSTDAEPTVGEITGKTQGKIDSAISANIERIGSQIPDSILSSTPAKREKNKNKIHLKPVNGMFETREGFDDDANGTKQLRNENASTSKPSKFSGHMNKYQAQSMEMLKVRAALDEKLRHYKFISSAPSWKWKREKNEKKLKPINRMLETLDDFDDDVVRTDLTGHGLRKGGASVSKSINPSLLAAHSKPEVMSGDYDLPKRDDIGERRRKHELRILSRAGIEVEDEASIVAEDKAGTLDHSGSKKSESEESENEFYEQVKRQRAARLAAKSEKYSRTPRPRALPEIVDGRRPISYEMERNRGFTRYRKKITKNPRKKYRTKHQTALVGRKGQVREFRRPWGPYGGEASGINPEISRSIRFKN